MRKGLTNVGIILTCRTVQIFSEVGTLVRLQPTDGVTDEIRTGLQLQFVSNMCAMRVDRLGAYSKLAGDLPRWLAFAHHPKYFEFTVGELSHRRNGLARGVARESMQDGAGKTFAQVNLAAQYLADRFDDELRARLLHNVAVRSGSQCPLSIKMLGMHRHNQDKKLREFDPNVLR